MYRYSGLIGPAIFFIVAFVVAAMLPSYSNQTQMISELGASGATYSNIFNYFAFLPNGILITIFGLYFYKLLKLNSINPIAAILVIIHGLGMLMATWLSCDITCTPSDPSDKQIAHNIIGAIKFPALHLAILIFAIQLLKRGNSKTLAYWSIFTFIVSGLFMVLFASSVESREFTGIYQRLFIGSIYIWLAVVSFNINKIMARQQP